MQQQKCNANAREGGDCRCMGMMSHLSLQASAALGCTPQPVGQDRLSVLPCNVSLQQPRAWQLGGMHPQCMYHHPLAGRLGAALVGPLQLS